jgi:dsDNA-specific endonuclease/ATPase MutS2
VKDKDLKAALGATKAVPETDANGENPEVVAMIAHLQEVQTATQERRLDPATTADERQRLRIEYNNVNTRILRLQAALFKTATQNISDDVEAIRKASDDLAKAIKEIQDLNAALGGLANLLGIVDSVLGLLH